ATCAPGRASPRSRSAAATGSGACGCGRSGWSTPSTCSRAHWAGAPGPACGSRSPSSGASRRARSAASGEAGSGTRARATICAVSEERLAFPREELRRRTVRGAVVNALFLGGAEVLVLVQGLIVTVLLGPRAVGLYGIVT